jgi:hypothetical protein
MKKLNIGSFEILPKDKEYSSPSEFLNNYSRKTPNSEGIIIADSRLANYLISQFKQLKVGDYLKNYYYTFTTEITIVYDPFGTGNYKEAIIDDPEEVINFQNGEPAMGYDEDGDNEEFFKGAGKIEDWREEKSIFFLVRVI